MLYAGARPQRVARVVSLEGFGIPAESPDVAPDKIAKWLDALKHPPTFRPYPNLAAVADRLQKNNPRLARDKAEFLAAHWARDAARRQRAAELRSAAQAAVPDGLPHGGSRRDLAADHRAGAVGRGDGIVHSALARRASGGRGGYRRLGGHPRAGQRRCRRRDLVTIDAAGHMLHLDRPDAVAAAIEPFLAA